MLIYEIFIIFYNNYYFNSIILIIINLNLNKRKMKVNTELPEILYC